MSRVLSGDAPPPGYISVIAAFGKFQTSKRGSGWESRYPSSADGKIDEASHKQWQEMMTQELQADESEFIGAIMSERFEVAVFYPDGRLFTITPDHIAESMWPPSVLIAVRLPGFPGDIAAQAIDDEVDTLGRYAGRTPLVKRTEFTAWLDRVSGSPFKRAKPGPKPKLDERKFRQEVQKYIEGNGLPNPSVDPNSRQADLERHMMQWHAEAVGESTNREYVRRAIQWVEANWLKK